jgi:hypothetical protein
MRNNPWLSRLAALLLLVTGAWSVWAFIEAPLLGSVARDRNRLAQDRALIEAGARDRDAIAGRQAQLAQWDARLQAASWRLDQASPELMTAQLQHLVQGFASQSGAGVASSRAVPVRRVQGGKLLGLEFDLQASPASLRNFLFRIETARPRIFVDRLAVQSPENGLGGAEDLSVALHLSIIALPALPGAI